MSSVFSSAVSGLNAAVARMSNAATNIANASTTGILPQNEGEQATSYQPTDIVNLTTDTGEVVTEQIGRSPAYYPMYAPTSPHANEKGQIAQPNVDLASEITDLLMAEISYKANLRAIKTEQERQNIMFDIAR